jgi:hypothetical protein
MHHKNFSHWLNLDDRLIDLEFKKLSKSSVFTQICHQCNRTYLFVIIYLSSHVSKNDQNPKKMIWDW